MDEPEFELETVSSEDERAEALTFVGAHDARSDRPALTEQFRASLEHHGSGPTILARSPDGTVVGLGQLRRDRDWELETVVDPPFEATALGDQLVAEAVRAVAGRGGGTLHFWRHGFAPDEAEGPRPEGFVLGRELLEMRVDLPLAPSVRERAPTVSVRAFRPGVDEAPWLEVNNRAFAEHPEQGAWDLATLLEREQHPWFDPEGFLLHEVDGRLAGSCWTKVHRELDPPMGEIYVISVDPEFHGRGLGRALTVAGLDHLSGSGLSLGMLYVDRANEAAVGLYRSLGFRPQRIERAYVRTVAAGTPTAER